MEEDKITESLSQNLATDVTIIPKAKVNKNTFAFDEDIDDKLKHTPDTVEQLAAIHEKIDQQKIPINLKVGKYYKLLYHLQRKVMSKYYPKIYKLKKLRQALKVTPSFM